MPHNEASAEKRVVTLREEIKEHNRRYYEEAAPTIGDREYDVFIANWSISRSVFRNSPRRIRRPKRVGGKPLKGFRANHASRSDAQSRQHLFRRRGRAIFTGACKKLLPNEKIPVVIEPKVDGVAVSLLYEKGDCDTPRRAATERSATISRKISARFARCPTQLKGAAPIFSKCAAKSSWTRKASRN